MDCLFCQQPIEDGDTVVDGEHGQAIVREDKWNGEVEYGSQISTVHQRCFETAKTRFEELEPSSEHSEVNQ